MTDSPETARSTSEPSHESYAYTPRWVIIAFGLSGYLVYALVQQKKQAALASDAAVRRAGALTAELDKTNAAIADMKTELQVTEQKLGLTEDELASARSMAVAVRKDQKK